MKRAANLSGNLKKKSRVPHQAKKIYKNETDIIFRWKFM
jgi:hypothetical protein